MGFYGTYPQKSNFKERAQNINLENLETTPVKLRPHLLWDNGLKKAFTLFLISRGQVIYKSRDMRLCVTLKNTIQNGWVGNTCINSNRRLGAV